VGGGLDVVEVQGRDPIDVLEDPGQLNCHALDLLLGELEPRQPGDVQDLLAIDHVIQSRRGR
jgi:hypothetical protein